LRIRRVLTVIALISISVAAQLLAEASAGAADRLTGAWAARARLDASGVKPFAELTTETWGNVAGGLRQGAWWNQLLNFGVELDTQRMGGWPGGKIAAQMHWVANSQRNITFADYTGTVNPVSGIMASDQVRVFNLYYEQSWSDEVVLKLGQIAVDDDFMLSDYTGLFANSAFGAMPSQVGNRLAGCCGFSPPFPMYSVAAPGIFLEVRPTEALWFKGGIYDGRPGQDTPDNHGFDWAKQSHWEAGVFFEAGYHYGLWERNAALHLGISDHTGKLESFSDPDGGTSDKRQAVPNYYAVYDQELLRSREGKTLVGLFCRAGITSDPDRSMVGGYIDGGLNWFGPIPGRPDDSAGIAASYMRFGQDFRASTGPNGAAADQTTVELAYKAKVTRCFSLQGDVQTLFNPAVNPESGARETAVVLGLRARLTF
jgi:porin